MMRSEEGQGFGIEGTRTMKSERVWPGRYLRPFTACSLSRYCEVHYDFWLLDCLYSVGLHFERLKLERGEPCPI